jgi:hypothetical protein
MTALEVTTPKQIPPNKYTSAGHAAQKTYRVTPWETQECERRA